VIILTLTTFSMPANDIPTAKAASAPYEAVASGVEAVAVEAVPHSGNESLAELVEILERELEIQGKNMPDSVAQACAMLGVDASGSLVERVNKCHDILFDPKGPPAAGAAVRAAKELINCSWGAGKHEGGSGEGYGANPWRFDANHKFVTERDGCNGDWKVTDNASAPGGATLRMDWGAAQNGNWAEFDLQAHGAMPRFKGKGSSYLFMRAWSIKHTGTNAPSAAKETAKAFANVPPNPALNGQLNDCARNTNDTGKIRDLVSRGAQLESTNGAPWNHTPLHQACYHGRPLIVQALLDVGAYEKCSHLPSNACGRAGRGLPIELAVSMLALLSLHFYLICFYLQPFLCPVDPC
jgi:hypothetical protein